MPLALKPRGKKKTYWIVGSLCGERIRESTRTTDRRLAEAKLIAVTKDIENRFIYGPKHSFTFAEAVELYVHRVQPKPHQARKVLKLLDHFGSFRCVDITPSAIMAYEKQRWSKRVKNSTLVSYLYGPLQAVLNQAARNQLCAPIMLPKPKVDKVRVLAAPEDFLERLLACELPTWVRAAVLLLTLHGTRPVDLGRLRWSDVSFSSNTIHFRKTKNGQAHSPTMHPEVRKALRTLLIEGIVGEEWPKPDVPVFPRLQRASAANLNSYLLTITKKNGLPFYSTHKIGRHAFATRLLNEGYTLKEVQEGGNWESIKVLADQYGHLERSRVNEIVTGMRIGSNLTQKPEAIEFPQPNQELEK